MKIFPGRGRRFIRRDGRYLAFIDQKSRSLYDQKIKSQRLRWTQSWRRRNKKGKVETAQKKKGKKTTRVFKSIAGVSIEDIKKRRDVKPDVRKAQRETALRELKEKEKKRLEEKKKAAAYAKKKGSAAAGTAGPKEFTKVPKARRAGKQAVKSTQR